MNKKDDEKDGEEKKPTLDELLAVGRSLFGAPDPEKVARRRKELEILGSLEYPGGKRVH